MSTLTPEAGTPSPSWLKSSFSFANGNCVEVADLPGGHVGVRDSKDPHGLVLRFTPGEWHAFIGGVRNGEFDGFGSLWSLRADVNGRLAMGRRSSRPSPQPCLTAQGAQHPVRTHESLVLVLEAEDHRQSLGERVIMPGGGRRGQNRAITATQGRRVRSRPPTWPVQVWLAHERGKFGAVRLPVVRRLLIRGHSGVLCCAEQHTSSAVRQPALSSRGRF